MSTDPDPRELASDHKAGEHRDTPSRACHLCPRTTALAATADGPWSPTAVLATLPTNQP